MKKALTAKFVEAVKPEAKRLFFADTVTENLILYVKPSGVKTWAWQGRMDGKVRAITLGNFPTHDLAAARLWATEITEKRDLGINIVEQRAEDTRVAEAAAGRTVNWLFDLYMEHDAKDQKSAGNKRGMYDKDIRPAIGDRLVEEITHDDLEALLEKKLDDGFPSASNHMKSLLCRLFKWAVTTGRRHTQMKTDPAQHLVKLADDNTRKRFLDDYEIGLFFKALKAVTTPMNETFEFILFTGVRKMEAFGAPWSEFDLRKGVWIVPENRAKNDTELLLPLPRQIIAYLADRRDGVDQREMKGEEVSELVWPPVDCEEPNYRWWLDKLRDVMDALAQKDGKTVEHFTPHDLRRSLSSGMHGLHDAEDKPLIQSDIVERVLNHKIGGVRGIYNRWEYLAEKKAALQIWADHLDTLRPGASPST